MEKDKTRNVAETIGNLIINGYRVICGESVNVGEWSMFKNIKLSKRYGYYDDNDTLQGFDNIIEIDIATGDITISHRAVEPHKRYRG